MDRRQGDNLAAINYLRVTIGKRRCCFAEDGCSVTLTKRFQSGTDKNADQPGKSTLAAAKLTARKPPEFREHNQREQAAPHGQPSTNMPSSISQRSHFCHLRTKRTIRGEAIVCSNVARGRCRKIICFQRAWNHGWDVENLGNNVGWIYPLVGL